ncbi:GEVED domain-containing protein [bacterium]|nr:GEVED domain-containing protein [bacterium]
MPRRHRPQRTHRERLQRNRHLAAARTSRKRLLRAEQLEDRRLLAVSFELNFLGGNSVGFNDPVLGGEYQAAMASAVSRIGNEILHDATIELDVSSKPFDGTSIGSATSAVGPAVPGGGFVHRVVPSKIIGEGDLNGSAVDGSMELFFFNNNDPFTYVTDPSEADGTGEIDFQAVIRHELVHMLGFTSNSRSNGSDDSGNGIITPGTWAPYDRFVSDLNGNRFINTDPNSPFVYQMDVTQWNAHSTGGAGPNAGLFFDGPIATAVYGGRVPLYSPANFSLSSSVSHLDSENYPSGDYQFSPRTHLMCHATVTGGSPQELTLMEKAILADTGMMLREDVPPTITAPRGISVEANTTNGFTGTNQAILDFLTEATAEDIFDPNPTLENDKPETLSLGENVITFTATDLSGNTAQTSAKITITDTTSPTFSLAPALSIHANTPLGANLKHPDLVNLILANATDVADDSLTVTADIDFFPLGATTVLFIVTDDSGNSSQASTTLTVTDNSLVITTLDDELDADPGASPGDLSLREAIQLANQNPDYTLLQFNSSLDGTIAIDAILGSLQITESIGIYGQGVNSTVIDAQGNIRVVDVTGTGIDVALDSLTISGGDTQDASEGGAGIRFTSSGKLSLNAINIIDNTTAGPGATGGGIQMQQGELSLNDSWINSNLTAGETAGGGGIWSQSNVIVRSSTISGNSTEGTNAPGGGLQMEGGTLQVINTTLSGNDTLEADGAGIHGNETIISIDNSTVVNNSASDIGGGIALTIGNAASLTIQNSVIANNTDNGTAPDFTGTGVLLHPDAVRYSLIGNNAGTTLNESQTPGTTDGNLIGDPSAGGVIDPMLLALSDYGGQTPSHLPELNSPLIDSGDPAFLTTRFEPTLQFDQRGAPHERVQTRLDIGSIETLLPLQIDWPTPEDIAVGTALSAAQLNASANVPGNFTYSPPLGTVLSLGQAQTLSATFTPDDLQLYSPTDTTVTINVTTSTPTLTWDTPTDIVFGTPLTAAQLNASANVSGDFIYTPASGTLLDANLGQQLQVIFNPSAPGFVSVSASVTINVLKAVPTITWNDPTSIGFGTPLTITQLNATSAVPGTFTYNPEAGTVLGIGNDQVLSTTFTPDADGNYETNTAQVNIDVLEALDFGDAPASYPVTLANNGARHIAGPLTFGVSVDSENDGQASPDASGDGSDEDGVLQITDAIALPAADTKSSFEVIASASGKIDAWIDFNADGDWSDPGEQIADNIDALPGSNLLSYVIPSGSTVGQTAARFRISSAGGLDPVGGAADGEVEDYMITLLDGTNLQDVDVDIAGVDANLFIDNAQLVTEINRVEALRLPITSIGSLTLTGRDIDQVLIINTQNNAFLPAGDLIMRGGNGSNTIQIVGDEAVFDLTDPGILIEQFQTLDLTASTSQTVSLNAGLITDMAPLENQLTVLLNDGDQLKFMDLEDWKIGTASILDGIFMQTASHQITNSIINVNPADPWQNFLRLGDVNGDDQESTLDALLIINELGRHAYSDANTNELFDPIATGSFPGLYFDRNGSGSITSLDALQILNDLATSSGLGEGESKEFLPHQYEQSPELHHRPASVLNVSQPALASSEQAQSPIPAAFPQQYIEFKRKTSAAASVDQLLADSCFIDELGDR